MKGRANLVDYLSRNTTNSLKGILALMVLLCHIHGRTQIFSASILGTLFTAFGYLAVSGFFFLSGYGLYEQYKTKENYIIGFTKNRILPYYITYCVVIAIYFLRNLLIQHNINWIKVAQSFFWGATIVDNGWYLQTQLILYIAFYLVFRFFKKNKIVWLGAMVCIYIIVCAILKFPTTWYESVLCFLLGTIFSKYSDNIKTFLSKKFYSLIAFVVIFTVFVIALFFGNKNVLPETVRVAVKMLSSLLFVVLMVVTLTRIRINNCVTKFLGDISLEIYVLQGLFLTAYRGFFYDMVYMLLVIISVLLASIVVHPIFKYINKTSKKLRCN